jgi:[ribosomal protein S5]-alanine N-acetyltransferase
MISLMGGLGDSRGFWLDPAWPGRGLMMEAVEAVIEFWHEKLGRTGLRASKAAAIRRFQRIAERIGIWLI